MSVSFGQRQRDDLVKLGINEPDGNLQSIEAVLAGEVDGSLRVLKIERLERVCGPVARAAKVKTGPYMLQQNSHNSAWF
jgi:hypothetical protein